MGLAVSSRASALIAVEGQHLGGASRGVWGGAPTLLRARPVVPRARPRRACGRRGREVLLDGLLGHVQRVRDLAVRASVGGHRRHPPFGGGESVGAGEPGRRGRAPAISSSVRARSASTSTASRRRSRSSEIAASVRRAIPIAATGPNRRASSSSSCARPSAASGRPSVASYASALAFSLSNSSCVIAPESSSSLAFAISAADPPPVVSRT